MRSNCLSALLISAALAFTGCHKRAPAASVPPAPPAAATVPGAVSAATPAIPAIPTLDQAESAFAAGSYDEAARAFENYLKNTPSDVQRDQALFHLGLAYAMRPAPAADWTRASATFKQLIEQFPNSAFKVPANLILMLRSDLDQVTADGKQRDQRLKQLATELERLKKIDADRRKKP